MCQGHESLLSKSGRNCDELWRETMHCPQGDTAGCVPKCHTLLQNVCQALPDKVKHSTSGLALQSQARHDNVRIQLPLHINPWSHEPLGLGRFIWHWSPALWSKGPTALSFAGSGWYVFPLWGSVPWLVCRSRQGIWGSAISMEENAIHTVA